MFAHRSFLFVCHPRYFSFSYDVLVDLGSTCWVLRSILLLLVMLGLRLVLIGSNLGSKCWFSKARVGFPTDRLAPSAARQLHAEHFHFPSSLECVEVLYDKLFIQVTGPVES